MEYFTNEILIKIFTYIDDKNNLSKTCKLFNILCKYIDDNNIRKKYPNWCNNQIEVYTDINISLDIIKYVLKNTGYNYKLLVKWMIKLGANNYNEIVTYAVQKGNIDLIRLCILNGANNFMEMAVQAVIYSQREIVKWMIELGANNYNHIVEYASEKGDIYI